MIEVEVPIVMLGRYSGKFSRRNSKFDFLGIIQESKRLLESAFSGFQRAQNPRIWQPQCYLWNIQGLSLTSRFGLLGGWNVCRSQTSLSYYFKIRKATVRGIVKEICEAMRKNMLKVGKLLPQTEIICHIYLIYYLVQNNCLCTCIFHTKH